MKKKMKKYKVSIESNNQSPISLGTVDAKSKVEARNVIFNMCLTENGMKLKKSDLVIEKIRFGH